MAAPIPAHAVPLTGQSEILSLVNLGIKLGLSSFTGLYQVPGNPEIVTVLVEGHRPNGDRDLICLSQYESERADWELNHLNE